jgi:hypothetical protein
MLGVDGLRFALLRGQFFSHWPVIRVQQELADKPADTNPD